MRSRKPYVVGIAGGTCSGKSHLARALDRKFKGLRRVIIECDSYYHDLSSLKPDERDRRNFDSSDAIEDELLRRHVENLVAGRHIDRPVYDFATHTRLPRSVRVEPGDLIIVEGLFALYWQEIRRMMDTKVFVRLPEETGFLRRLERDVRERGRTRESVVSQYLGTVKPMNDQYVQPTAAFADIVVDGTAPVEQSTNLVFNRIMWQWERTDQRRAHGYMLQGLEDPGT